jgi:hypothetical protein
MRIKHIQLAEKENSFILRDNNHYSGMCMISDGVEFVILIVSRIERLAFCSKLLPSFLVEVVSSFLMVWPVLQSSVIIHMFHLFADLTIREMEISLFLRAINL